MIRTFDDLFEKLFSEGRCKSIPEKELAKMTGEKEEAELVFIWMDGYLFGLLDAKYISQEEWGHLTRILQDLISK